jgi:hypothetical protein
MEPLFAIVRGRFVRIGARQIPPELLETRGCQTLSAGPGDSFERAELRKRASALPVQAPRLSQDPALSRGQQPERALDQSPLLGS